MNTKNPDQLSPFSCDLHIHSALSACAEDKMTPGNVLKKIVSLNIDIFSITDHNSVFNCAAFEKAAKEHNLLFIPGVELQTSEEIHLLGYFPDIAALDNFYSSVVKPSLPKNIKNDPLRFGHQLKINTSGVVVGEEEDMLSMALDKSIDELVEEIHKFEGIAVAAHIDRGFSLISQLGYIPPHLKIDAVEVWDVAKIEDFQSKYLKDCKLNVISSSDSHYLDMMKKPKMKLVLENKDVMSCLNCIKGEGPGRITINPKTKKSQQKVQPDFGKAVDEPSRDWKNLYK